MTGSHYVLIESRDPFDSADTAFVVDAATGLRQRGSPVTVFLVQNGVLTTRAGARGSQIPRLIQAGVTVLADDCSLRERGIEPGEGAGSANRDARRPPGASPPAIGLRSPPAPRSAMWQRATSTATDSRPSWSADEDGGPVLELLNQPSF